MSSADARQQHRAARARARARGAWPGGGAECEYIILPAPGTCSLTLSLAWFFLKQTPNCTEERLEVMGSRLCGDLSGREGGMAHQ